jgi:hypothetical protein
MHLTTILPNVVIFQLAFFVILVERPRRVVEVIVETAFTQFQRQLFVGHVAKSYESAFKRKATTRALHFLQLSSAHGTGKITKRSFTTMIGCAPRTVPSTRLNGDVSAHTLRATGKFSAVRKKQAAGKDPYGAVLASLRAPCIHSVIHRNCG